MFNIKEYNTIYKSYLNYILYNLYSLFFNIIKYKNKKKSTKQLKIYFNILSFKSISNLSYNNYYLLKNLNLYYTISIPIKINFISTIKTFNINYNIINIPKINQIGDILLNGYNRTSILYLKTTIKYINFRFNNNIYTKYLIYLSNFNYLYIYIYNFKYIYIYINKFYYINIYLTYFNIYNNYIYLNIYNIINLFNKYYNIINNNLIYNINIKKYIYKIFFNDIIYIIKKFINIKYNKIIKLDSDNIINKNIYSIYNNIFNLFKKSINLSKFIKYFKYLFNNFIIYSEKSNISIFREYFLLNPSLHYTNQLNLLAYLHNKFKLNIFGYSNKLNDKFIIPKNLRNIQYNYLNIINILYTIDGDKCGILSTLTTNTIESNLKFKTLLINKKKFNNNIYLDIYSKNFYNLNIINLNILKKNIKYNINKLEFLINGEFKIIKLKKNKSNISEYFYNIFNITELVIPFLLNNDLCRSLMGSKMHTQTLPLIYSNNQYVYTKYNKINNLLLNKYIISKHIGIVIEVTNYKIIILDNKNRFINYYLCPYTINDYNSYIYYKPIVWKGEKITIGKILATPSDINNFEFTLGINNIINYSFYYGYEHEDSIILNKKLVFNNTLTSLFFNINEVNLYNIDNIYIDILCIYNTFLYKILYSAYTKLIKNKHIFSKKIFFKKKRGKKQKLFFKYTYIYNIKTSLDRLIKYEYLFNNSLNKLFLNKFIYLNLKLFLVNINNINIGDKLCGRHGNKGTIAKIIDFIDTPYTSKDFYPYIITSPIGALSRMNIGQFLEGFCGNLGYNNNIRFKAPIELINSNIYIKSLYNYFNNIYIDLYSKYLSKKIFRDFKTGYKLKNFTYCVLLYYFKLMHTSKTKFRYKSYNKHIIQQQIFKDVLNSDQKFGEMEIWSLEAYGAVYNIKELSLIKSNYKFLQNSINKLDHIYSKIFKCLLLELKSILINIKFNKYYSTINNFYKININ